MDQVDARSGDDATDGKGQTQTGDFGVYRGAAPVFTQSQFESHMYTMTTEGHGLALIINNRKFKDGTELDERRGSDVDEEKMKVALKMMQFDKILTERDLEADEMKNCLLQAAQRDHTLHDCFVCVILTYGEEGYVWGTDNTISIDELVAPFKGDKCLSLAGKPKIFFIQACKKLDPDAVIETDSSDSPFVGDCECDDVEQRRIPTQADFLLVYSGIPGIFSWRNPDSCSWFIQAIVDVFRRYWEKLDLLTMMTRVERKVAYDIKSLTLVKKQLYKMKLPYITSMLTKDVYFY